MSQVDSVVVMSDALCRANFQSVTGWVSWHLGDCISFDWKAAGLSTLNDSKLFGMFCALQSVHHLLDSISEIHVFSNSVSAIKHVFDTSLHST